MTDFALILATPPPAIGRHSDLLSNVRLLLQLSLFAVIWLAAYRAFSRPQPDRFAYLRLGWLELQLVGYWMLVGIAFIAVIAFVAAATAILVIVSGSAGRNFMMWLFVSEGVGCVALAPFLVRLSMLPLAMMDRVERPLRLSWRLTGKIFWPFGACLYAVAILPICALALIAAFEWSQTHGSDGSMSGWIVAARLAAVRMRADPLHAFLDPIRLIGFVVTAGIEAVSIVLVAGVVSTAYGRVREELADISQRDVFD